MLVRVHERPRERDSALGPFGKANYFNFSRLLFPEMAEAIPYQKRSWSW
jgi:hypothetical protein